MHLSSIATLALFSTLIINNVSLVFAGEILPPPANSAAASAIPGAKAIPLPKGKPHRPVGIAAIAVAPKATPPFTLQDVVAYFQTHNLPSNLASNNQFQVNALTFLTSGAVSKKLQGVSTGLNDDELVGFATLSGTLIFPGPGGTSAMFSQGYAVFDATTGNLLMVGTL